MVTEPYLDPISGKQVVSIVTPVLDISGSKVMGFVGFDVFVENLAQSLSIIKVGENGYLELVSNSAEYIYSDDETAMGKNVSSLDISDDYKNNVTNDCEGTMDFSYGKEDYTAISKLCESTGWQLLPYQRLRSTLHAIN